MDEAQLKALCAAAAGVMYAVLRAAKLSGFDEVRVAEETHASYKQLEEQHGKL